MSCFPSSRPFRLAALWPALVVAALLAGCRSTPAAAPPPAPDTWATVNGRPISREDVEKAYRRTAPVSPALSDDEAMTAKLNILNELIVQDLLLQKATELKVELPDSELDTAYADGRKDIPEEAFQKELAQRNLTAADMRESLRRDLLTQKVIEREVAAKVTVSDQDVTDFFNANRAQFNRAEEAYRIAQIVVTPGTDPELANRTGDDAATPQQATAKAQMLMERLKSGAPFGDLAADFSEDPESAPRGGDLGFVPVSAIQKAPPQLRDAVIGKEPGAISLVNIGGTQTIALVVAHDQAGQKDLSTPGVRESITNTLRGRKEQLLRTAYLSAIRNGADVTNHLAGRLVEAQGALPSLAPAAPGTR
ncbi:MAG: SurA N-terminal domain-containing protein [Vicinamibacterales bacterium]